MTGTIGGSPISASPGGGVFRMVGQAISDVAGKLVTVSSAVVISDSVVPAETVIGLDTAPALPVTARSLIGRIPAGTRVVILLYPPRGVLIIGAVDEITDPNGAGIIAHVARTTASTASAAGTGVLRLDDVPVKAGRRYWVGTSTLEFTTSIAGTQAMAVLGITTDGSIPTTASPKAVYAVGMVEDTTNGEAAMAGFVYAPPSDLNLSVLLWTIRVGGALGTVSLYADAVAPCSLQIIDLGVAPPSYGTVL